MRIKINTKDAFFRVLIWLMIFIIFMIFSIYIRSAFATVLNSRSYSDGICFFIVNAVAVMYCFAHIRSISNNKLFIWSVCLFLVQAFGILISNSVGGVVLVMRWLTWLVLMFAVYKITKSKEQDTIRKMTTIYSLVILLLTIMIIYYQIAAYRITTNIRYNVVFLVQTGMPIVFFQNNKVIRLITIVAVGIASGLSLKATSIVIYVASLLVICVVSICIEKRIIIKNILILIVLCVALFSFSIINSPVLNFSSFNWGERVNQIIGTGGSGRIAIWEEIISKQLDSGIVEWFFGHGYNSTLLVLDGFTAHNDFLEALYDYGIIGFWVYISFLFSAITIFVRVIRLRKKRIAIVMGTTLTVFVTLSMVSHLVIYPVLLINIGILFGLCVGMLENVYE